MSKPTQKKEEDVVRLNCGSENCKSKETRFGFCDEHYDQFKFGLITKAGKKVLDYERKMEHYLAFKEKSKQIQKDRKKAA